MTPEQSRLEERAEIVAWLECEATYHDNASFDENKSNFSRYHHGETAKILKGHINSIQNGAHKENN